MKLLVAGMASSGPAARGMAAEASRSMVLPADIGDGEGLLAGVAGKAESGQGVTGFAGLGDDDDRRVAGIGGGVSGVFAGVFDIDGEAAEVLKEDFSGEACVAAGAAGGDEDFATGIEPVGEGREGGGAEAVGVEIEVEGALDCAGLLIDFAEHGVRESGHELVCSCPAVGLVWAGWDYFIVPRRHPQWGQLPSATCGGASCLRQVQIRVVVRPPAAMASGGLPALEFAEAGAGFVEVFVFFGEAEAEEVFSAAGAEEGGAGDGGYAGGGEQVAGFFSGGFSGEVGWRRRGRSRRRRGRGASKPAAVRALRMRSRFDWWSAASWV